MCTLYTKRLRAAEMAGFAGVDNPVESDAGGDVHLTAMTRTDDPRVKRHTPARDGVMFA